MTTTSNDNARPAKTGRIDNEKLRYGCFCGLRGLEIAMTLEQALSCSHSGRCDDDVDALLRDPAIAAQLDAFGPEAIRAAVREYGAWSAEELTDDDANRARALWSAACDIRENPDRDITDAGHDLESAGMVRALCTHLDCAPEDLTMERYDQYGLAVYSLGRQEYAIGTDAEADAAVAKNIRDSVWAFNASFLASYTGLPEEMFAGMQDKCEDANDAFLTCVERAEGGFKGFVEEAVSCDGRGHFLSGYDGAENEEGEYFIYRIN